MSTKYRIDKIEHDIRHPADDMIQDWEDQAIVAEQNDMRKNLLVEAQDNLELVNQALRRLENDQYGVCVVCGEDIEDVPFGGCAICHDLYAACSVVFTQ
ncbi:TraR/DksA family transcriptional regulator [Faucicola atlantae]|uniref:TraR/DksA family transcriptional regulator n=1 Tax=Faucicola atlantae TaxID=34059 RepID=UPI0025B01DC6|nr:conjugal transfer protein TraR [Moraxella atlantae]